MEEEKQNKMQRCIEEAALFSYIILRPGYLSIDHILLTFKIYTSLYTYPPFLPLVKTEFQ